MAKAINDSFLIKETVVVNLKQAAENRYSWRLRFAVAEHAAKLSNYIDKEIVDEDVISIYELLMRDSEPEVRSESVARVPEMASHCSPTVLVSRIIPIIQD